MSAQNKNDGKVKWALIFKDTPNALLSLARVAEKSIKKYARLNWSESIGKPDSARFKEENLESIIRHAQALLNGEEIDQETGEHHGGHIMRRASFCVEYYVRENPIEHQEYQEDPAWEIDQLVTWPYHGYQYFYFNEDGAIFYGINAPVIMRDMWIHSDGYTTTKLKAPDHLRKYWKESVRKKS
jgi:hypothetical protein